MVERADPMENVSDNILRPDIGARYVVGDADADAADALGVPWCTAAAPGGI